MNRRLLLLVALGLTVTTTEGCGTVLGMVDPECLNLKKCVDTRDKVYIGARVDISFFEWFRPRVGGLPFGVVELPIYVIGGLLDLIASLGADTLLLPYTLQKRPE